MLRATVKGFERFDELDKEIEAACIRALDAAAEEGARAASEIAAQRHRTGAMERMEVSPAAGDIDGFSSGFRSAAWYARFQNDGTTRGITPLRFFQKGRSAGRRRLLAELDRL